MWPRRLLTLGSVRSLEGPDLVNKDGEIIPETSEAQISKSAVAAISR